ncbi:MAG TPA: hypothetical protein VKT82_09650 [Ktedonobacterales bacterium]|nr:hypothetical protein [Ktedonobacterales bacterium]
MVFVVFLLLTWLIFCLILLLRPGTISRLDFLRPVGDTETVGGAESRGDMSGVREPRRPKPSYWPPQAAAAIPEDGTQPETSSAPGYYMVDRSIS